MQDSDSLSDAFRAHVQDQAEAQLAACGRGYAIFYAALVSNGIPPVLAADLVQRQQGANLTIAIQQAVGG